MNSHTNDNFVVYFNDGDYCGKSKVYAIDCIRDRFLVAYFNGSVNSKFLWVDISDCEAINMEEI